MAALLAERAVRSPRTRGRLALALVVAVAGALAVVVYDRVTAPPTGDELFLGATDFEFSDRTLRAAPGAVEISFANTDAVPHTFTIPELDVHLEVGGGEAKRTTFAAEPGRYQYVCTIPGHDTPGMRGVLTVAD